MFTTEANSHPYLIPQTSLSNRMMRMVWDTVHKSLFRFSPRPCYAWRSYLLRLFGAQMGPHTRVSSTAKIWAPWNLTCEEGATIGPNAIVYNPKPIRLGVYAIL